MKRSIFRAPILRICRYKYISSIRIRYLFTKMSSSKKKITQDELRRIMNEQKKKLLNNVKKIESPLARYDKDGTLNCILCETVVRSEAVWKVHVNSKTHKQNILNKVHKKEEPSKVSEVLHKTQNIKRPVPDSVPVPPKKIKGILKNTNKSPKPIEKSSEVLNSQSVKLKTCEVDCSVTDNKNDDTDEDEKNKEEASTSVCKDKVDKNTINDVLPEGFFDDPKLDAKVRNVEYIDPVEEEWEKFLREMKEETSKAQKIIAEDQEEATTERQIDEIDEQIRNWSRVVNLEKKKEEVNTMGSGQKPDKNQDDYSGDEEDFEEFLDWRSKKSFDYKLNKNLYLI